MVQVNQNIIVVTKGWWPEISPSSDEHDAQLLSRGEMDMGVPNT